ncbi:MAG: RNA-binding protein [Halothermotrichaceae bacterium]
MISRYQVGEIVFSTKGRDFGKYYMIVDIKDEKYVRLSDGAKRPLKKPKLKNIKHLQSTGEVIKELSIWLSSKKRVRDEDIKKAIKDYENNKEAINFNG